MATQQANGRTVLARYRDWAEFARSLDDVQLLPPRDNYGEQASAGSDQPRPTRRTHRARTTATVKARGAAGR